MGAGFALVNYAFDEIGNPALRPVRKRRARTTLEVDNEIGNPDLRPV
jgi:hypothetical protein